MRAGDRRRAGALLACAATACAPPIAISRPRTDLATAASRCSAARPEALPVVRASARARATLALVGAWGDDRERHAFGAAWTVRLASSQRATGGRDARVVFWEPAGGRVARHVTLAAPSVDAQLTADGATLVVATEDDELVALDAASGAVRWRTRVPASTCRGIALSPDARFVTEGPRDDCYETGRLPWRVDATTGALLAPAMYVPPAQPEYRRPDRPEPVRAVAIDPTNTLGARLVVTRWERVQHGCVPMDVARATALELFDLQTGARRAALPSPPDDGATLAFDATGRVLSARAAQRVSRWDAASGALIDARGEPPAAAVAQRAGVATRASMTPTPEVRHLAAARERAVAAWAGGDGVAWATRPEGGAAACAVVSLPTARPFVRALALDPAGSVLDLAHSAPVDATVERWDLARRERLAAVQLATPESRAVALMPAGRAAFEFTFGDETHAIVDLTGGAAHHAPGGAPTWRIDGAAFRSDGAVVFAGSQYNRQTLRAWDIASGRALYDIATLREDTGVAISPDDRWLAFEPLEGPPQVWDIARRRVVAALAQQPRGAQTDGAAFSVDGALVALASRDGMVRVYGVPDGALVATVDLDARADTPSALAFSRAHLWIGTARGAVFRYRVTPAI